MSNKIAKISIPDGPAALGTEVTLADGSKIGGIASIKLEAGVDNPRWTATLEIHPNFIEQLPFSVELTSVGIGIIDDLTDEQFDAIYKRREERKNK
ncbi:hypothetical protein [Acinetobacter sp. NIPH 298]|uniref:hypothetical protein n=1 Tax=Acinetobacter sp. NIPH 298 TaxID=1217692 RepID=UPI0002D0CD41|nr:hypothetical protein [Acinetobacter sp. NIPH 298]ENW95959.1 hypothetical protein F903_01727 [Acinetobacter sp. NIPH 298]